MLFMIVVATAAAIFILLRASLRRGRDFILFGNGRKLPHHTAALGLHKCRFVRNSDQFHRCRRARSWNRSKQKSHTAIFSLATLSTYPRAAIPVCGLIGLTYILHVQQRPPDGAPKPSGFSRQCLSPSKGDRTPAQLAEQFDAPY